MKECLLDANMLLALAWPSHPHHRQVHLWMASVPERPWATCAMTQSAFIRLSCNPRIVGATVFPHQARDILARNTCLGTHTFWREHPPATEILTLFGDSLVGYRQVTDAYLLGLAVHHDGVLATLDRGLEAVAGDEYQDALEIVSS